MAGNIQLNAIQLGNSTTATQNFVWQTNLDGTTKLARGNIGATTQDILIVDSTGKITLLAPPIVPAQSMVRVNTTNGYGSTNTGVRRWTNVVVAQGSDIAYTDSATLGSSFTINTNGVYSLSYTDNFTAAGDIFITKNATTLNATPSVLSEVLAESTANVSAVRCSAGVSIYLQAGDVIRTQSGGAAASTNRSYFTITRVA